MTCRWHGTDCRTALANSRTGPGSAWSHCIVPAASDSELRAPRVFALCNVVHNQQSEPLVPTNPSTATTQKRPAQPQLTALSQRHVRPPLSRLLACPARPLPGMSLALASRASQRCMARSQRRQVTNQRFYSSENVQERQRSAHAQWYSDMLPAMVPVALLGSAVYMVRSPLLPRTGHMPRSRLYLPRDCDCSKPTCPTNDTSTRLMRECRS